MTWWLVVNLALSLAAVGLAALAWRRTAATPAMDPVDALPEDVHGLRQEVAALRAEGAEALRHLSVVRYDAFPDVGGHLSWSVALADDAGDGVVRTSIHGRSDARTYATAISGWACEHALSPEEQQAISHARA